MTLVKEALQLNPKERHEWNNVTRSGLKYESQKSKNHSLEFKDEYLYEWIG
jgi:hypothetical protein